MKTLDVRKMENLKAGGFWGCALGVTLLVVGTAAVNPVAGGVGILVMAAECHD